MLLSKYCFMFFYYFRLIYNGWFAIRVRYQSRWSHVGVIKNGMVHEACHPQGVIDTSLVEFKKQYGDGHWEIATAYAEPGWDLRADSLLGLLYDW